MGLRLLTLILGCAAAAVGLTSWYFSRTLSTICLAACGLLFFLAVVAGSRPARAAGTQPGADSASYSAKVPSLSQYKLDMSTAGLRGLIELSPAEYTALGREPEFVGEKVFHAPSANFLGIE